MERVQTVSEMRDNIDRLSHVIGTGAMFTAEDAKALQRVLEKLSWHRNQAIRFALTCKASVGDLAELWGLSVERIVEIGKQPLSAPQFHEIKVLDYPNLLHPESPLGDREQMRESLKEMREQCKGVNVILPEEKKHDFRVMWSVGDPIVGYEFTSKHPGPESMASGVVESWTPKQLEEHLNEMEKFRPAMSTTGATTGRVSCAEPNSSVKPSKSAKPEKARPPVGLLEIAKTVGKEFKKLRTEAGINQTDAGKLIGESQMYVSMLERGKIPNKKTDAPGMQLSLQEFKGVIKTLGMQNVAKALNPTTE
jgi:DNA-binding XRE family transcriptional regulator